MNSHLKTSPSAGQHRYSPCDACAARREYIRRVIKKAGSALARFARFAVRARDSRQLGQRAN